MDQQNPKTRRNIVIAVVIVLVIVAFGYVIGSDLAKSDARSDVQTVQPKP